MFILFHCFISATTKEIRRAECAKQSARLFYYSELKDMNALKVLSDTNSFKYYLIQNFFNYKFWINNYFFLTNKYSLCLVFKCNANGVGKYRCFRQSVSLYWLTQKYKILGSFRKYAGKIKKRLNRLRAQNLFCCHFCHSNAVCNVLKNN